MVRGDRENKIYAGFPFVLPTLVHFGEVVVIAFPGINLTRTRTQLSNSCSRFQQAMRPLCRQRRRCVYEFLAANCEFSVTATLLILFSIFLVLVSWCYPQKTSETLSALCPISCHSSWSPLITCSIPLMSPHWAIHSQAHNSPALANMLNDAVSGPALGTRDTAGKDTGKVPPLSLGIYSTDKDRINTRMSATI